MGYDPQSWDRGIVEQLAREWPKAEAYQKRTFEMMRWLEADPAPRFHDLVDAIVSGLPQKPRGPLTLEGVFTRKAAR